MQKQAVALNGRFLAAPATGVQRVAEELIKQLDILLDETPSTTRWTLFVPANAKRRLPLKNIAIHQSSGVGGRLWEQLELPKLARGQLLVSLCNQAPLLQKGGLLMIHDAQAFISPESYSLPFRFWYGFGVPRMGAKADRILTVSNYSRDKLVEYRIATPSKTTVIYNGIDHVSLIEADGGALQKFGLSFQSYVVALSNTQKHKNIPLLFEIFRQPAKRHLKLVLVGSASKEDFVERGLNPPDNAIFCGIVSDAELRSLYEGALCLAFPSTTEGFGLPPLEAMLLGCPAVVAPRGALPEVCDDAALYADPDDPAKWSEALDLLQRDPAARESFVRKGLERAAAFKWSTSARQLMALVEELSANG